MIKITFTDYIDETLIAGTVQAIEARAGLKPEEMSVIEFIANDYASLIQKQKKIDVDTYADLVVRNTRQEVVDTLAPTLTKPEIEITTE